jgi:hypothetical protein
MASYSVWAYQIGRLPGIPAAAAADETPYRPGVLPC